MKRYFTYLIVLLLLFGSCGKDVPAPGITSAIFYVKGQIGNKDVDLRAGDESYYMFPGVTDDSLDIRSFEGVLGRVDCPNQLDCPQTIRISIREGEKGPQGRPSIDQNISLSNYEFRGPPEFFFTSYRATFISNSMPSNAVHYWEFGDGSNSLETNPVHTYINEKDSIINPILWVSANASCGNTISYETRFLSPCDVDFTPKYNNGHLSWASMPHIGRSELWDLTNGYMPLGPNNLPPLDSVFTACVESTDTLTGCVSYKCKNIVLDTAKVGCVANFDVIKETIVGKDVRDFSEVTITWVDENGKSYSSERFKQPGSSWFEIVDVAEFVKDDTGNRTKKITVRLNVRLFGNDEFDYLDFHSEESVFAISYL